MEETSINKREMWSNRWLFVLAAAGSAVGLGNIWKFPYIAGENGGGAFVLIYLACIALVGVPIMMAEILIGRAGRASPIASMQKLSEQASASRNWKLVGWLGVIAGFLILSYYAVIAGWALNYVWISGAGSLTGISAERAETIFNDFLSSPWELLFWHSLFMIFTISIVARGIGRGLETAVRWFMPLLFVLLVTLLIYGFQSGGFDQAFDFMFDFKFDVISTETWLIALGQAFFTLSLGMGAMMAYGSYVPSSANIGSTVITIALLDSFVAIASGLAIFPIVFANGLEPGQGPGLMFVTVPLAFGQMTFGSLFGTLFFLLVSFAAITSAISLTEPAISYLVEKYNASRARVAISLGVFCWMLGIGTVLSFNLWAEMTVLGKTFFDAVDYLSQNIMLPLGGLLIAFFAAWRIPGAIISEQLNTNDARWLIFWKLLAGVIAPLAVALVFLNTLFPGIFQILGGLL